MRLEYQHRTTVTISGTEGGRIYGERVKPGYILKVLTCFLHVPNAKIADVVEILIEHGDDVLEIRSRARDAAKQGMSALNPFYVGEYQRIIGQTLKSTDGDHICLTVIGEMIPLKKWRKGNV